MLKNNFAKMRQYITISINMFALSLLIILIGSSSAFANDINDFIKDYSDFFNFGNQNNRNQNISIAQERAFLKKVDVLGRVLKSEIDKFKSEGIFDLLFLIDDSSSVGESNFLSELKFVKKILSDIILDSNHTRISVVTFSSHDNIVSHINEIPNDQSSKNKCKLLYENLNDIWYTGGGTYTLGAFKRALEIYKSTTRIGIPKVLFLITDGFSNGGDPVPFANQLKSQENVTIFTIGVSNGNFAELYEISTSPGETHSYLLDSFQEFENLARRALHVDLQSGDFLPLGTNDPCNVLCNGTDCCDENAICSCGTFSGQYTCLCKIGYYGSGLNSSCLPCPSGSYAGKPNLCLPCPDVHHITIAPAVGQESCTCKSGFVSAENNTCDIIKCSKLLAPENGYFVKSHECSNVYNSACGVRCNVGFTLSGSSIRLCQENATWSGQQTSCQVRTCPKMEAPMHGIINCNHTDLPIDQYNNEESQNLPVDTVCHFQCKKGRTLIGSKRRTCLPLAQWDGLKTSCKQIKCNKILKVKNGVVEPKSCTIGKQAFEKSCNITCLNGFTFKKTDNLNRITKVCNGEHGTWNNTKNLVCIDTTPPQMVCPKNITIETLKGKPYGILNWIPPEVSDNSKIIPTVWSEPVVKVSQRFKIGKHQVTNFARDNSGNQANCSYFVEVQDLEPPTIEGCYDPEAYLVSNNTHNITWDEPNIFDNSQNVTVSRSRDFGWFTLGMNQITYTAVDFSNNSNICTINITVQEAKCKEDFLTIKHATTSCKNFDDKNIEKDNLQCSITCDDGYALLTPIEDKTIFENLDAENATNFECHQGVWNTFIIPQCTAAQEPDEIQHNGELSQVFEDDTQRCETDSILNKTNIEIQKEILTQFNCEETNDCNIKTETVCKEELDNSLRFVRDIERTSKGRRNRKKLIVKLDLVTRGNVNATSLDNLSKWNTTFWNISKIHCPRGMFQRKNKCYLCPQGTFHNNETGFCQSCPIGTYNDQTGQIDCILCPKNHSTRKFNAKSINDCAEQCPPGTYAHTKIIKRHKHQSDVILTRTTLYPYCSLCPIEQYQPNYGQKSCLKCPSNKTTSKRGAKDVKDCEILNPCTENDPCLNNGQCVVVENFGYKCLCPNSFTGSNCEIFKDPCSSSPCQNEGVCRYLDFERYTCDCPNEFSGFNCEVENYELTCKLNCTNNSTCVSLEDENEDICLCSTGFAGDLCQIKTHYCSETLCENGGTCIEFNDRFKCSCKSGYLGLRCTYVPCDFKPCPEYSICVNDQLVVDKTSFQCICPLGFRGNNCSELIDYCTPNLCQNNATCNPIKGNYTCKCRGGYRGRNCEELRRQNFVLTFANSGTTDFVRFKGPENNLTDISMCTWIKTNDTQNYGTLLSYATEEYENAFTITDYNGIVFYVNNKHEVTDTILNDGLWHHFCLIWSNQGTFQIYLNADRVHLGHLGKDTVVSSGGILIIGQEQDSLGGKFSQAESFVGSIAYMDIYDKILTQNDISEHMNDCSDNSLGSLYSWSEFADNIMGAIKIENATSFCSSCPQPKVPINGFVHIQNSYAFYGCNIGYTLDSHNLGRRCLKSGRWDGNKDPICAPISCGHPGVIKNGYFLGNKFIFGEEISYKCNYGFKIVGVKTRRCTDSGAWEPAEPKCLNSQCHLPKTDNKTIEKFVVHSEDEDALDLFMDEIENPEMRFDTGSQIEIVCRENSRLMGADILTCLSDGTWDLATPKCVTKYYITCSLNQIPLAPLNGYLEEESHTNITKGIANFVSYKCREGYKQVGEQFSYCIVDGYWSELNMICKEVTCADPLFLSNFNMEIFEGKSEEYKIGHMIRLKCRAGYKIFGEDPVLRCLHSGHWSKRNIHCLRVSCGKPLVNTDSKILGTSHLYTDKLTLICKGKRFQIECTQDAIWLPKHEECFL